MASSKTNLRTKSDDMNRRMYYRIRNLCGLLGVILPWLALFSAGIAPHPSNEWWWSISATYYQSPALVGVLVPASIVLISYIGYDWKDNLITSLSGIFGLGIVLFPCRVSWIEAGTKVGFFQIPMETSNIIHTACALIFFLLIAINSICQFTISDKSEMSPMKKVRNTIYRTCGWLMIAFEVALIVMHTAGVPGYSIMIIEIILLTLFGFAWLVKGEAFPFLNDKPQQVSAE